MKTSLRRASKRTLALLLGVLMLITTAGIGTLFTANAVTTATTYYLWYNNDGNNDPPFKNHLTMSQQGSNYVGTFDVTQSKNFGFLINTSTSHCGDNMVWSSAPTLNKPSDFDNYFYWADPVKGSYEYNDQKNIDYCFVKGCSNSNFTMKVVYNPSNGAVSISKSDGSGGGGGTTDPTTPTPSGTKYYYRGDCNNWQSTELNPVNGHSNLYYYHADKANKFKITDDPTNWEGDVNVYGMSSIDNNLGGTDKITLYQTTNDNDNISMTSITGGYIIFNSSSKKIYAVKTNPNAGSVTKSDYTVGVATNYSNATVTATVKDGSSVSATETDGMKTISKVKEYKEVTFSAKSDGKMEFKGWFSTADPKTTGNSGKGYNAVSMDETFKIELRSDVKIYALYSDSQDEKNGGIVSGAVYYYSAPEVSIDILDKSGTTILKDNNGKASVGDTITVKAKITKEAEYYINRVKPEDQKLQYLYNFYEIEKGGEWHLLDSQTGSAAVSSEDDPRLTCTTETTFSETSKYCVQAYCVYVDPEESPFSYGVSQQVTVRSDTEVNTEKVKVYIDFNKHSPQSAAIVVTDANDIGRTYKLTKLGSDSSSNIYYADDVVVAYTTKENVNTMKSDFVSINVDGERVFIDDADQPELSSLLQHKILWYRANDDANMKTNITQTHYVVKDNMGTNYKNKDKFRPYTYRTQSNALSTKRIYLTNNTDNGPGWSSINVVYSLNKAVDMTKTGYSNEHNKYIWFQKAMNDPKGTNAQGQTVFYVDLPYNVTAFYFENGSTTSSDKAEVHYKNDLSSGGNGANNDFAEINEANAYYFDSTSTVRMWPDDDRPETPAVAEHISDLYIVKGQTLDITATLAEERDHSVSKFSASYVSNGTSVATVSTVSGKCTLTAKGEGTTTVTIKTSGEVTGVKMNGISETIKVTVIDKDKLRDMIAEAEYIIGERNEGRLSEYTQNSYAAFETVYNVAIDVYNRSLYNQAEVDTYAALLREAMENLCTEDKVSSDDNQFDLIAYNTSDVKVISDGNGKVNRPTITDERIKPYIADVKDGEDKNIGYEIIYAEGFGFSCVAQKTNSDFIGWTRDGNTVTEDETLTVEKALPKESVYIAKFEEPVYKLTLNYKFKDFDVQKAGTNEYKDNCLKDEYDSYTLETFISIDDAEIAKDVMKNPTDEAIYGTKVNELAIDCVPDVMSSYYVYSYPSKTGITDKFNLTFNDDNKTAELNIILEQKPREYSIFVNGEPVGEDYHYQEQVTLNAEDYLGAGADGQKYKWLLADANEMDISTVAEEGNENILSLQKEFTVRAFEDKMSYTVSKAEEGDTIDKTSVISPAYTEVIYKDNTRKIQQNFYIQDNLANRDDLKSAGNIFYYWNHNTEQPVDRTVRAFYKNKGITKDTLKALIEENYSTWDDVAQKAENHKSSGTVEGMNYTYYYKPKDESTSEGLLRYSSANSCWGYIFAVNSADNWEKYQNYSYRVHSFFILDDGTVIVSNTYAQARVNLQPSASGD